MMVWTGRPALAALYNRDVPAVGADDGQRAIREAVHTLGTPPNRDAAAGIRDAIAIIGDLSCRRDAVAELRFDKTVHRAREHASYQYSRWFRDAAWASVDALCAVSNPADGGRA